MLIVGRWQEGGEVVLCSDGTIPKLLLIPIRFRFCCEIYVSDTIPIFVHVNIQRINIVITNYFPALVSF